VKHCHCISRLLLCHTMDFRGQGHEDRNHRRRHDGAHRADG
jgi:hypothetical protein